MPFQRLGPRPQQQQPIAIGFTPGGGLGLIVQFAQALLVLGCTAEPGARAQTAQILLAFGERRRRRTRITEPRQFTGNRHAPARILVRLSPRSEEHTSELQSLMRISYAVFCL